MAEGKEKSSGAWTLTEALIGAFVLFLIFNLVFQHIGTKVKESSSGSLLGDFEALYVGGENTVNEGLGVGKPLAVGTAVTNTHAAILYNAPGGAVIGSEPANESGTITDGPIQFAGENWWKVKYADGSEGYVTEGTILSTPPPPKTDGEFSGPLSFLYGTFRLVSSIFSFALLVGMAYCAIRLYQIRAEQDVLLDATATQPLPVSSSAPASTIPSSVPIPNLPSEPLGRMKWELIQRHIGSNAESDWRLAILEADILLDEMLRERGFFGENLGEKLKNADPSDFQTLQLAWEAHKTRNSIAHEGVNFALSNREARRVIDLFERVFQEFEYI